ncbi:MAG: DUF4407 domain-containing protein [Spirosomataceae bacterium]
MKQLNKILFWASGARTSLLDKITEFEKRKFQLIGASLLISAFVSTLSAFYAISLISQNTLSSLLIGLMWGIMVNNLNRLLISSILDNQKDKQRKFFWFLPSLILSIFIALTIAFPLQLKVFETEINSNIVKNKVRDIELVERGYDIKIEEQYSNLKTYQDKLKLTQELVGSGSREMGYGSVANQIKSKIIDQEKLIETLRFEKSKLRENIFSSQSNFIEKTNSLNEIIQRNNTMRFIYYLLILTFLLVELIPFVIAYASKSGLYEELVEKIESSNFDFENKQTNEQVALKDNPINTFENFCVSSIIDINHNIDSLKGKAKEQLRSGLLVSLIGILAYLGYGTFLFIVYFETHKFQNHHIFLFSSLSVIFFFMQFLGGWYLKQYRTTMDYANSLTINKERYNKYILAKIATTNLPNNETNKLIETKLLFDILGDGKISETLLTSQTDNNNFAKDVFDSINSLKDLINNIGKAGK